MPLVPIDVMMTQAREGGYAVGYFESWNLESLQGTLDAAEGAGAPVIIGFNGDFLCRPTRQKKERLQLYAALGRAAAEGARVPCGFIFNECPYDEAVYLAADSGFNLVMPADAAAPLHQYAARVRSIVDFSHARGVAVEAEIGELPCGSSGIITGGAALTDPLAARDFVAETGVDLLAVSSGNVHIMVQGQQELDLGHLAVLANHVEVPLVLHGGSGIEAKSLRAAIERGVAKVNYGTYLKQRYLQAIGAALQSDAGPHDLLGIGGNADVMLAGRQAVCDAVLERLPFLGCEGQA